MIKKIDYFYDSQMRRYLDQLVRAFSGIQYEVHGRNGGEPELRTVPCTLAERNRQASHILKNNSENSALTVPRITIGIGSVSINRERTRVPGHVGSVHGTERERDEDGNMTSEQGIQFTIDRMIPHPIDLTIIVDIWTSNEHQKHQIFEQLLMAFNVGFVIQNSDNALDWSSMTDIELVNIDWSSSGLVVGVADEIDIMTLTWLLPIWINPPAKVKQQKLIHQIVTSLHEGSSFDEDIDTPDGAVDSAVIDGELLSRSITTPENAFVTVDGNYLTLSGEDGSKLNWEGYLSQFGEHNEYSKIYLLLNDIEDFDNVIIGTFDFTSNPEILFWQPDIDTLPANTLKPINRVINPLQVNPATTLEYEIGDRFVVTHDIAPSRAWDTHNDTSWSVSTNDIIEYTNDGWKVVFKTNATESIEYLVNLSNGKQLQYIDGGWYEVLSGSYPAGFWRIFLS